MLNLSYSYKMSIPQGQLANSIRDGIETYFV